MWNCVCLVLIYSIASKVTVFAKTIEVNDLTKSADVSKYIDFSDFSREFYWQCAQSPLGNVIVSPLSVANSLAFLSQGANGKTLKELRNGLRLTGEKLAIGNRFAEYHKLLAENAGSSTLWTASRVYVGDGQRLDKDFQIMATKDFNSTIKSIDFAKAEDCANQINGFVSRRTNGKIDKVFQPSDISSDISAILVNVIYFKGTWEHKFKTESTRKKNFFTSETEKLSVDFMYTSYRYNYAYYLDDLDASALELKYKNSTFSFLIVLPDSRTGLSALEQKLKDYDLTQIIGNLTSDDEVDVEIPKFKIEFKIQLDEVLKNMGMTEMFTNNADFGEILEDQNGLKLSNVVHTAVIEINEEGTEAAAATAIEIVPFSASPAFIADHPFVYFIRDTVTNTIIFSGHVVKF